MSYFDFDLNHFFFDDSSQKWKSWFIDWFFYFFLWLIDFDLEIFLKIFDW
jgi:hypothetical protein